MDENKNLQGENQINGGEIASEPKDSEQSAVAEIKEVEASVSEGELSYDTTVFEQSTDLTEGLNFSPRDEELPDPITVADTELAFYDLSASEESKDEPKKKKRYKYIYEHGGALRSLAFTVAYIAGILVAGVVLGYFIIEFANEVFAFSKDDTPVEVVIKDDNITLDQVTDILHEEGIIKYPFLFKLYVAVKYDGEIEVQAGKFTLAASYNYDKLIYALDPPIPRTTVTITFPEGITTDEVIEIFLANGIGTREGFEKVIEEYEYEYWFLEDLETTEERYYRLDGYLYPDTYQFYSDSSESAAIKKLISNFNKKFGEQYQSRIDELGLTVDQVVIIASMIEAEAYKHADFAYISAVFHNRLKSEDFRGKFESDATVQYILSHEYGGRHEELTAEDLAIDSPYNTRMYEGFTPGPICNPSLNALKAALYPDEECGYFYFVANIDGSCLWATTLKEHEANIELVKKGDPDAID